MQQGSDFAKKIDSGDFIITAEILPSASADPNAVKASAEFFKTGLTAVNVADNPHGPILSSLAGALILSLAGIEPIFQVVTRDRNRIAIQSDLLGAAALGINNVLCLSGHHQSLTGSPESSNVYDIDSIQLIAAIRKMCDEGVLLDGSKIMGSFSMVIGAVASPHMKPMELNILRLSKKVDAGARFIQTQAVFDTGNFEKWIKEVSRQGLASKAAILAGVMPLQNSGEAQRLRQKYTDLSIPDHIIERLKAAGDGTAQKKEGLAICVETIKKIKAMDGVKGIHILSGGCESSLPEILSAI
jgi:methylenetetrahydrofolate reductase (NADPH)